MNSARFLMAPMMLMMAGIASACWYPTFEPQYYLTYNLQAEADYESESPSMIDMWRPLLPGASATEIKSLIYSGGYGIEEISELNIPAKLRTILEKDSLLHDYIVLMRQTQAECAKTTDPWYFYHDNDPKLHRLDSLAKVARGRLSGIYGDRYAVQAARALRALKRYGEIIDIARCHTFKDTSLKSLFDQSLASAYYYTGRYEEALELYRQGDDEASLEWTLEKLGLKTGRLALARQLSFSPGKESPITRLLQAHIRQMEVDNDVSCWWQGIALPAIGEVISIARDAAANGLECYRPIWQYTEGFAYLMGRVDYAKADSVFSKIDLEKASPHLRAQVRTLRFITQSYLRPYDSGYKDWLAREAEWLCAQGAEQINRKREARSKRYADTLPEDCRRDLCQDVLFFRNTHKSYCYPLDMLHRAADCIVVPKMLEAGDSVAALQLLDVVDYAGLTMDEIKMANSHGCASICFAMELGADIAEAAQSELSTDSPWTTFIKRNGSIASFPDSWYDLVGTLLLGEARYGDAVKFFDRISSRYATIFNSDIYTYDRNPFALEFLSDQGCSSDATRMKSDCQYYKKWFAQRMSHLETIMNDNNLPAKERAESAIEYATGMANSVYPCWFLTQYGVGESPFFPYSVPDEGDNRRSTEIIHDFVCEEYRTVDKPSAFNRSRQRLKALRKEAQEILRDNVATLDDEEAADICLRMGQYLTIKHRYADTDVARRLKTSCDRWSDW